MKKLKLRSFVLPTLYLVITILVFVGVILLGNKVNLESKDYDYGTGILDDNSEVVNSTLEEDKTVSNTISSPIDEGMANVAVHFYQKEDDELRQQESLIYYENTYLPNTGVLYSSNEAFDVKAAFDGKVIDVLNDEFFGKYIVVEHSTNLRTYYYGLSDINVKKDDQVSNGQVLGLSNNNEILNDKKTFLFEVYYNNEIINPEEFIGTKITDYKVD